MPRKLKQPTPSIGHETRFSKGSSISREEEFKETSRIRKNSGYRKQGPPKNNTNYIYIGTQSQFDTPERMNRLAQFTTAKG